MDKVDTECSGFDFATSISVVFFIHSCSMLYSVSFLLIICLMNLCLVILNSVFLFSEVTGLHIAGGEHKGIVINKGTAGSLYCRSSKERFLNVVVLKNVLDPDLGGSRA